MYNQLQKSFKPAAVIALALLSAAGQTRPPKMDMGTSARDLHITVSPVHREDLVRILTVFYVGDAPGSKERLQAMLKDAESISVTLTTKAQNP